MMELTIWDLGALAAKLAAYLGCFLAMGSTLYGLATPGLDAPMKKRLARLVVSTVIIAVLASLAQIAVQSGRLLDEGFAGEGDQANPISLELFKKLLDFILRPVEAVRSHVLRHHGERNIERDDQSVAVIFHRQARSGLRQSFRIPNRFFKLQRNAAAPFQ